MIIERVWLDLHNSEFEGNIMTEYEEKFSSRGQRIYRVEARLLQNKHSFILSEGMLVLLLRKPKLSFLEHRHPIKFLPEWIVVTVNALHNRGKRSLLI